MPKQSTGGHGDASGNCRGHVRPPTQVTSEARRVEAGGTVLEPGFAPCSQRLIDPDTFVTRHCPFSFPLCRLA